MYKANDGSYYILGAESRTFDVIEEKLKPDICNVVNWSEDNRMTINYDKIKIHFDNYMPETAHTSIEGA